MYRTLAAVATVFLFIMSPRETSAYIIESENGFIGQPIEELIRILNDDSRTGAWANVVLAMGKSEAKREAQKALLEFIARHEPILASNKPTIFFIGNEVLSGKRYAVIALGSLNTQRANKFLRQMLDRDFATKAIAAWSQQQDVEDDPVSLLMGAAAHGLVFSRDPENEALVRAAYAKVKEELTSELSMRRATDAELVDSMRFFSQIVDAMVHADLYRDGKCCGGEEYLNMMMEHFSSAYGSDLDLTDQLTKLLQERAATQDQR